MPPTFRPVRPSARESQNIDARATRQRTNVPTLSGSLLSVMTMRIPAFFCNVSMSAGAPVAMLCATLNDPWLWNRAFVLAGEVRKKIVEAVAEVEDYGRFGGMIDLLARASQCIVRMHSRGERPGSAKGRNRYPESSPKDLRLGS